MEESRKAFEQWALEIMQFTPDELTWDERRNCYRGYVPHMAWKGWQASRAAIHVELPDVDIGYEMLEYFEPEKVISAIRAAGIKVKE